MTSHGLLSSQGSGVRRQGSAFLIPDSCFLTPDLDAAFLGGAAAVVRQWSHVLNRFDGKPGRLQSRDSRLTPRAGTFHLHLNLLEAKFGRLVRRRLGRPLRGKRSTLSASLE